MQGNQGKTGTIVVVGAHPDDETLGCGGTIARRVDEGHEVVIIVLTDGRNLLSWGLDIETDPSPEKVARIRRDETRKATEILGVREENVLFLDFPDGELAEHGEEVMERVLRLLRERSPAEVWFLSEYEGHPDHMAVNRIVSDACAQARGGMARHRYTVGLKYGLSLDDIPADLWSVDISEYLALKTKAVNQFQSHLGVLSGKQKAPLWQNADRYLERHETFILDAESRWNASQP